jgi:hypothetical protein
MLCFQRLSCLEVLETRAIHVSFAFMVVSALWVKPKGVCRLLTMYHFSRCVVCRVSWKCLLGTPTWNVARINLNVKSFHVLGTLQILSRGTKCSESLPLRLVGVFAVRTFGRPRFTVQLRSKFGRPRFTVQLCKQLRIVSLQRGRLSKIFCF